MTPADTVLKLQNVTRVINGVTVLKDITWTVRSGQHWVILGPNGSGKTTLLRIASMWMHPSTGMVELLGERLGRTDVRRLRSRVGFTSPALADRLRPQITSIETVMTAKYAALEPWWHSYTENDHRQALQALKQVHCQHRAQHQFGTLSSGERQRVLLARALSTKPGLILLDEPNDGLDLPGREQLFITLRDLANNSNTPPLVLITHHTEAIPDCFTHMLLIRRGNILAQGRISDVLTEKTLSACFGMSLKLQQIHGRWMAHANHPNRTT